MNRIFIGVIAALTLALAGLGWVAKSQYDSAAYLKIENKAFAEALERAEKREQRDRKVLVARQGKIASQARKLAQAEQALSEALQRNKAWSDTDVPDEVQKALQAPSTGL